MYICVHTHMHACTVTMVATATSVHDSTEPLHIAPNE